MVSDFFKNLFSNKEYLRNTRSISLLVVIIILPLMWFGYKDTFNIDSLITFEFAGISIVIIFSAYIATKETKTRAFEDMVEDENTGIKALEKEKYSNAQEINKLDKRLTRSSEFMSKYNKEQQENYNRLKTEKEIRKLEIKIRNNHIRRKHKKAEKLEKKVGELKDSPLVDKSFIDYNIRRVVNVDTADSTLSKKKGDNEISVDPKRVSPVSLVIKSMAQVVGVGVAGVLAYQMGLTLSEILWFYFVYFVGLSFTVLSNYALSVWVTSGKYTKSLTIITKIQKDLIEYLNKPEEEEKEKEKEKEKEEEKGENDVESEDDLLLQKENQGNKETNEEQ